MAATKVTLVSSCGDEFELDEEVATHDRGRLRRSSHPSPQRRHQDFGQGGRVLEEARRMGKLAGDSNGDEDRKCVADALKTWDAEFVNVDRATLCDLVLAANYREIKNLLDLICQTLANMIGKSHEEIREMYGIENDFTPEEEEEIRKENR